MIELNKEEVDIVNELVDNWFEEHNIKELIQTDESLWEHVKKMGDFKTKLIQYYEKNSEEVHE